jgi:hypothetical protein
MSKSTRSNLRVVVLVSGRGSNLKALAARADDGTLHIDIVAVSVIESRPQRWTGRVTRVLPWCCARRPS